jgi:hypothetical protein
MFRTLLAHLQDALHKQHLVYCVRVMSVGCTRFGVVLLLRATLPDKIFTGDFASWTVYFVDVCVKTGQMQRLFIQFINYVRYVLHVSALYRHLQGTFLVPSERCSIEEQSIEYCGWACCVLSISQKALGTLPEDGNVMPKHVEDTIHN